MNFVPEKLQSDLKINTCNKKILHCVKSLETGIKRVIIRMMSLNTYHRRRNKKYIHDSCPKPYKKTVCDREAYRQV
jgi:hypothetical protein